MYHITPGDHWSRKYVKCSKLSCYTSETSASVQAPRVNPPEGILYATRDCHVLWMLRLISRAVPELGRLLKIGHKLCTRSDKILYSR